MLAQRPSSLSCTSSLCAFLACSTPWPLDPTTASNSFRVCILGLSEAGGPAGAGSLSWEQGVGDFQCCQEGLAVQFSVSVGMQVC